MIRKRQLLVNALASGLQVVVTGATFFVLYRFVKDEIGIEYFGVWSLVLATTSVSSLANLGMAASVVKFVSTYLARDRADRAADIVQTGLTTLGVFLAAALVALYPLARHVLALPLEPGEFRAALSILPYAFVSFWITSVAGVLQGGIDGHQRVDLRSLCLAAAALAYLAAVLVLVPERGLVGLAQAQVFQAGLLLAMAWLVLRRLMPTLPAVPHRWKRDVFREILGYSLQFQIVSVFKLLTEPVTKYFVMTFGGAATAGYFEFAHRMAMQLRTLVVTAHQSIVPTIADLQERASRMVRDLYTTSFRLVLYLILCGLPLLIALVPWVSEVWLGSLESEFVAFSVLLCAGWFLNMLSNPAYFAYLGIGKLRWVVVSHVVIGVLNVTLGPLLGAFHGGIGVAAGFVAALLVGSFVTAAAYQISFRIRLSEVARREDLALAAASLAAMALAILLYDQVRPSWGLGWSLLVATGSFATVAGAFIWSHSMRRRVQGWFADYLFSRADEADG